MENRTKILIAAIIAVLAIAVIILVGVTNRKESEPELPGAELSATPIPSPSPSQEPVATEAPSPTQVPSPTETGTVTPELTPTDTPEMSELMKRLLGDPYGTEINGPLKSVTFTFHAEQEQNLDRHNNFFIDVADRLEEQGVDYIPFSIIYDSKREYTDSGYRIWRNYTSTEGDQKDYRYARVYDFKDGTFREYTNDYDGEFSYRGTYSTDETAEKYLSSIWPRMELLNMFSDEALPELTETEDEYIIEGLTTTSGYEFNGPVETVSVDVSEAYGFQYLIRLSLHYDKAAMRIKWYDAEVIDKVWTNGSQSYNHPLEEKVESDIGIVTSLFHAEFTDYNSTSLNGLPSVNKEQEERMTSYYAYTFLDGSKYWFKADEWETAAAFLGKDAKNGYRELKEELEGMSSPYEWEYVFLEDLPEELHIGFIGNEQGWTNTLDSIRRKADAEKADREKQKESGFTRNRRYEKSTFAGYYIQPPCGYLCSILLDKKGGIISMLQDSSYTGYEYSTLISVAYDTYTGLAGEKQQHGDAYREPSVLRELFYVTPDKATETWEYVPNSYRNASMGTPSQPAPSQEDVDEAVRIVRDDFRKRFEEKLKAWLDENGIGSATNPNRK